MKGNTMMNNNTTSTDVTIITRDAAIDTIVKAINMDHTETSTLSDILNIIYGDYSKALGDDNIAVYLQND